MKWEIKTVQAHQGYRINQGMGSIERDDNWLRLPVGTVTAFALCLSPGSRSCRGAGYKKESRGDLGIPSVELGGFEP